MTISRFILASTFLLLLAQMTGADAQTPLAQLRQDMIAPWLITVQGEDRTLLLRINEIVQDTEGSYAVSANYGWLDGVQSIVRIELILSGKERRLVIRVTSGSIYSVRQSPGGDFTGTFKPMQGTEKQATMYKVSEEQLPQLKKELQARLAARSFADEDKDWGIAPRKQPRSDRYHAPTPTELPGGKLLRTMELSALRSRSPAPVLIDVLGGEGHRTIPGSHWLKGAGLGTLDKAENERLRLDLEKLTAGRKATPVVFFCLNSECWLSYNTGLRAIGFGYTNVYWFRGGISAWERAGFEMKEAELYRR